MGCAQSRIENEEEVARCKQRKQLMREAVAARNAFAVAHADYTLALKNEGAALSGFGHGETHHDLAQPPPSSSASSSSAAAATAVPVVQPPIDTFPLPPPPLPFSPSPLQRSVSLPELPKKFSSKLATDSSTATIREEDDGDEPEDDERRAAAEAAGSASPDTPLPPPPPTRYRPQPSPATPPPPPPPPPPQPQSTPWDYFFATDESIPGPSLAQPEEIRPEIEEIAEEKHRKSAAPTVDRDTVVVNDEPPVTPEKVVVEPPPPAPVPVKEPNQGGRSHHQHAASTGTLETKRGRMVPAAKPTISLLQVLNQLDEHFVKASESGREVSKMLEANRMHYHSNFADNQGYIDSTHVLKVITWNKPSKDTTNGDDGKGNFDNNEWETHATVLDKILAWEKKLYDEVKAYELIKIEYQRKVALLNKQKKHGATPEAVEKTKAAVSHLHTRYIVDMQSMDTTVSEIMHLRDNQLYPKLVCLIDGLDKMWETMYTHHDGQLKIVSDLRDLDISNSPKETSEHHYEQTDQLWQVAREWHSQFDKLMRNQKDYIDALNSWFKLNLPPTESSLKEKASSPPRVYKPPIQTLLHAWHDQLEKLQYDLATGAIVSFAAVINTIMVLQQEEIKQKVKCEETRKEYMRKARAFEDWYHKHSQRTAFSEEANPENSEAVNQKDPVAEKRFVVESLKSRLDDEVEAHQQLCKQVREKSLGSLKTHLPELFRRMSEFAFTSSVMYKKLKSTSQTPSLAAD